MILIACIDDQMGMMFNHRRQSQDRLLRRHILQITAQSRLWMDRYSAGQFPDAENIVIDDACCLHTPPGEYCLIEKQDAASCEARCEQIILFRWNRRYPSDHRFDIPLKEHGWMLTESSDFAGYSHEKITEEIYIKSAS